MPPLSRSPSSALENASMYPGVWCITGASEEAVEDSELYEVSTQHFNSDSHRLIGGD
jgi:hypothetical protein